MMLVFKAQLLVIILIGLFTGRVQTAESRRRAADERREQWRLLEGVSYLFGEAEGSCAEALIFCRQRGAAVAVMTTKNQAWMESQAEGRKLWMNMLQDDPVTGLSTMTVRQCPEQQSSDPIRLNSTEERGCVCERRGEESPSNAVVQRSDAELATPAALPATRGRRHTSQVQSSPTSYTWAEGFISAEKEPRVAVQ
ncbi:hypothetical protein MHYP_G00284490 [Metynnis hypsauchen]